MESRKDRNSSRTGAQSPAPTPKKRFRIEKLEERIAPKKKGGGGQTSSSGASFFGSASVVGPY